MSSMSMVSPVTTALMSVAMMVAMMLPSIAPTLWRRHRQLRTMRVPRAGQLTTLFATGYVSVWIAIGLALFAMSAEPPFASWTTPVVVLLGGMVQSSRWKAERLRRCRDACVPHVAISRNVLSAWRDGSRLGIDCGLSCAAPMAVLFVVGLMDARMTVVITAAITAERVAKGGARIARMTGALALIVGLVLCTRAIGVTMSRGVRDSPTDAGELRLHVAWSPSTSLMPLPSPLPRLIQGGMGVAVSDWRLANAVARTGQLGVVSGSMLDTVFVRRLQDGDPDGHLHRAIAAFPVPEVGAEILRRYYVPGGRGPRVPYKALPMYKQRVSDARQRITVLANFTEVWLAKEGHDGPVGLNLLTKVSMPNLASLYGAMLAGVDVVIMGAGIPREIPGVLDAFAAHRQAQIKFDVERLPRDEPEYLTFDPASFSTPAMRTSRLERPAFIAVVSAASLATTLARKSTGRVDGFIVEGPTAGGHNAPPRGEVTFNDRGEPVYGERDVVDLSKMRELAVPFWLAGGAGSPDALEAALAAGAAGVQVGTLFAYCNESGLDAALRARVLAAVTAGTAVVRTDPRASPTGYPFKVVELPGDADVAAARKRVCDLGYLRVAVRTDQGRTIYRCSAEPVDAFIAKGGDAADTVGRRCLCNGLTSNVEQAQWRDDTSSAEPPLVTSGDDLLALADFAAAHPGYTARDVVQYVCT